MANSNNSMAHEVEFGELPGPSYRMTNNHWHVVAAQLRARPGEWAKVHTATKRGSAYATHIKQGHLKAFRPSGSFEATVRGTDTWARYVGGEQA